MSSPTWHRHTGPDSGWPVAQSGRVSEQTLTPIPYGTRIPAGTWYRAPADTSWATEVAAGQWVLTLAEQGWRKVCSRLGGKLGWAPATVGYRWWIDLDGESNPFTGVGPGEWLAWEHARIPMRFLIRQPEPWDPAEPLKLRLGDSRFELYVVGTMDDYPPAEEWAEVAGDDGKWAEHAE